MRMSVDGGALQLALNILRRGTPVQVEAAQELERTADTDEFRWRWPSSPPTHSGVYWAVFGNGVGVMWEGPITLKVEKVKGRVELDLSGQEVKPDSNCWQWLVRYCRIPHQEYEEPVEIDAGQATIDWS